VCALCRSTKQAVEPAPAAGYGFQAPPGALSQARPLALCSCISSDGVLTRIDKSHLELELNLKLVELVDPEPLTSRPNGLEATGSSLKSA
jgi:hypothetical protein